LFDARADRGPVQAAQAASERRNRDRHDAETTDVRDQSDKASVDVFDPAVAAPVTLRREVDHPAGGRELAGLDDQHPTRLHLVALARLLIDAEVLGVRALELGGDTSTHDADAVHGVHQRLGVGLQDVASGNLDHRSRSLASSTTSVGR
jgi:hypothetical protein